jgi:hypothetical protein
MNLADLSDDQLIALHKQLTTAPSDQGASDSPLNPKAQALIRAASGGGNPTQKDIGAAKELGELNKLTSPAGTAEDKISNLQAIVDKSGILANAFQNMTNQGPKWLPDQLGGKPGRIRGLLNSLEAKTGMNPAAEPYQGDLNEAATGLAAIATGGNSIRSPQLVKMFKQALPSMGANWQEFGNDFANVIHNAAANSAALSGQKYDPQATHAEALKMLGTYMPPDEFAKFKQSYAIPGQKFSPPSVENQAVGKNTEQAIPPESAAPEVINNPSTSSGTSIGKILKGLVGGASIPGEGMADALMMAPLNVALKRDNGQKVGVSDIPSIIKGESQKYNQQIDKLKSASPGAAVLGSIPQNVAAYSLGTGLLSELPGIGAAASDSKLGKLLELTKQMGRGGAMNSLIGQAQSGGDLSRLKSDFGYGAGGELLSNVASQVADAISQGGRNVGGRLYESILKRPRSEIASELSKGEGTLGQQLYDRGAINLGKTAENGLAENESALQDLLKGAGDQPINKKFTADQLSELKNYFAKIPGREGDVAQVEDMMKKYWNGPDMSASDANELKRSLYKENAKSYLKELNPTRADADMASARGLKQAIEDIVPQAKGINQELSVYGRLNKALNLADASGAKKNMLPIGKTLLGLMGLGAGVTHEPGEGVSGLGYNFSRGIPVAAGLALGGTELGKTGTAQSIRMLMELLKSGAGGLKYAAPIITGATAQK